MKRIIIQLSSYCDCVCPGCYNYRTSGKMIESDDLLMFLSHLKKHCEVSSLTLSGGEPLLRKDIVDIVYRLKTMGFHLKIDTTGLQLINRFSTKDIENIFQHIDCIGIPIDGSNDFIIEHYRKGIGINEIKKILQVIQSNKGESVKLCVNTVAHKENLQDLENIYLFWNQYKFIDEWQVFQYMPIGPGGSTYKKQYEISDSEFEQICNHLKCKCDSSITFTPKAIADRKNVYILVDSCGNVWKPQQSAEKQWEFSDNNDKRIILGNVFDKDIIEIIQKEIKNI